MMILFGMEMATMIAYAVMGVGVVGMIWAAVASKKNPSMKVMLYVFLVVIIGTLIFKTFLINENNTQDERMINNTKNVQLARVVKVADYIAEKWPNGKVSFLVNGIQMEEQTEGDFLDKFVVAELKNALSERGVECSDDYVTVGKMIKDSKGEETYENPTDTAVLTKALKPQIDKVNVVINFVGLPEVKGEAEKIPFLSKKVTNNMNNMIVMTEQGLVSISKKLIDSGRVTYVVTDSPDESFDFDFQTQELPKDLSEVFSKFYAFIDKDGYADYVGRHANFFPED